MQSIKGPLIGIGLKHWRNENGVSPFTTFMNSVSKNSGIGERERETALLHAGETWTIRAEQRWNEGQVAPV